MTPSLRKSWVVWVSAALFFCYQFVLRVSPSVMAEELMMDFRVDACSLGILTSLYLYAYSSMQIPVGTLLDKFGPRRLLISATILCIVGAVIFATAENVLVASASRFLIGLGSAFGFLSCMKVGALWFPAEKISLIVGLTLFMGTFGAMAGAFPLSFLVDSLGWRQTLWITAALGLFTLFIIIRNVKANPPDKLSKYILQHHAGGIEKLSILEGFKVILQKRQTWLVAFYGTMMYVPLTGFADMWGVPFMSSVHHLDKQSASLGSSFFYLGIGVGTPLFGLLSDRIKRFKPALVIGSAGALALFYIVIFGPTFSVPLMTGLLFIAGIFTGGQFMAYAVVTEINPLSISGMATGCQNMACLSSGIFFQPLIGWILDMFSEGPSELGTPIYSPETYKIALSVITICLCLAVVSSFFIREAYPREK